jgi:D-galacturonate reductase
VIIFLCGNKMFNSFLGTHYAISLYAIERGIHVLVTKPATQLLSHHNALIAAAKKHNVVCFVEHHKRFDPVYSDAKARAASLGEFNFFSAWMSQPKSQLETFRAWAGKDSDIRQVSEVLKRM